MGARPGSRPDVLQATDDYERWLRTQVAVVEADLECKHELMRDGVFTFFRGAYYRWIQMIGDWAPELRAPDVPAVGDLHVENFGTWRDGEGRLVWGINDFDESEELPYTYDLARLATSARLATEDEGIDVSPREACEAILGGYARSLKTGGEPFVLAGEHRVLADMVNVRKPKRWWKKQLKGDDPPGEQLPPEALEALEAIAPPGDWRYVARRTTAGVGSRGRPRFLATGERDGAPAARELKQLAAPAGRWLDRPATAAALDSTRVVRSRDPLYGAKAGWLARRLAPDCVKIELEGVKRAADQLELFESMGRETANIHLGAAPKRVADVRDDLEGRDSRWLSKVSAKLAKRAREDWRAFSAARR
jgi:hypothetical protein